MKNKQKFKKLPKSKLARLLAMEENTSSQPSPESGEMEPEIIVLQYETEIQEDCEETDASDCKNLVLQVAGEQIAPFLTVTKGITEEEYKDQPDLVKKEDFDSKSNSTEGGEGSVNAALCVEAEYDTEEVTCAVDSIANDQPGKILLYEHLNKDPNNKDSGTEEIMLVLCQAASEADFDKFTCIHCELVVGCIYCLKTHFESQHSNAGVVQYQCNRQFEKAVDICPKCNLICKDQEDVTIHRSIHFVKCTICGTFFDSPLYLSNHCKMMHKNFEVVLSCDLCNDWFKDLMYLSNHYDTNHNMIICIVCLKRFPTKALLEEHHRSHTLVIKADNVLPFACNKCDMAFEQINDLCRHITQEHPRRK